MNCIIKGCNQPIRFESGGSSWRLPSDQKGNNGTPMKGLKLLRICYYHEKQRDGHFGEVAQFNFHAAFTKRS